MASGSDQFPWETETNPSLPVVDNENHPTDVDSAIGGMSVAWVLTMLHRMVTANSPGRSSTDSLQSSIYESVVENGRTYHRYKHGNLQHTLFKLTLGGKLYLAPINANSHNVLDFATGTGIWAIEFARDHPSARVVGTDLSAIQPLYVPPNCRFEIDDAEDEWVFSERFDYIHGRALLTCFQDPSLVINEAFKSLAPGGYLEMQDVCLPCEYIGPPPKESALYKWNELVITGAAKLGRPWTNVQHYKRWMEETGFDDVIEELFYWPTSAWAKGNYFKDIAMYFQEDMLKGLEGLSLKAMRALEWSVEDIQVLLADVRSDVYNTSIHAFLPIKVVYGRKPGGPAMS